MKIVGEPIDWTDEEIDRMSQITPEDIASAAAMWNRQAPRPLKKLLNAKPRKPKP